MAATTKMMISMVMIAIYDAKNNDEYDTDNRNDISDSGQNNNEDEEGYCISWLH